MPASPRIPLRIAVVQTNPKIGQVQANLKRAKELCAKLTPRSLDLLCFPEMAFTGYVFENAAAIRPHLELPKTGPTSQFCADLAKRLQCYVAAGYPEQLTASELASEETANREENVHEKPPEREVVGANSAVIYSPEGEYVAGYRKTNLFKTDKTWATPGNGFLSITLPDPLRRVTLGICMDINVQPPAEWTSLEGPYELATHTLSQRSNVLILLNNWLQSDEDKNTSDDERSSSNANEGDCPDGAGPQHSHSHYNDKGDFAWATLNFWAERLRPLWAKPASEDVENSIEKDDPESDGLESNEEEETIIVVCNRTGEENGQTFAGTSALFGMQRNFGRPKLLNMMEQKEEDVRIWKLLV